MALKTLNVNQIGRNNSDFTTTLYTEILGISEIIDVFSTPEIDKGKINYSFNKEKSEVTIELDRIPYTEKRNEETTHGLLNSYWDVERQVRVCNYEGGQTRTTEGSCPSSVTYSSTYYDFIYEIHIEYLSINKLGEIMMQTKTLAIVLPVYDPNTGLEGENQLRINANGEVACFELVDIDDVSASSVRVKTSSGIKAIAKED